MIFKMTMSAALFLAAMGPAHAFELKGFKGVDFGANRTTIESLGFNCRPQGAQRVECAGQDILFGLSGSVRAWLSDDKVNSIRVVVVDKKPVNLVDAYTQTLGKPEKYVERWPDRDVTVYYWIAKDGTSVSTFTTGITLVVRNPDTGEVRHSATADYMDKAATAQLLAKAKKAGQIKRHF